MSRGLGAVQRRVLEQLRENTADPLNDFTDDYRTRYRSWTPVLTLAGDDATRSQIESVRRAVNKLHAAGLVAVCLLRRQVASRYVFSFGWQGGGLQYSDTTASRMLLCARLTLPPDVQLAYEQAEAEHKKRLKLLSANALRTAIAALATKNGEAN
jgi:hypothetical protein